MRNTQLVEEAKYILKKINQSPKKSLGQNFLVDSDLLQEIARLADIQKNENIVEIGPGLGWLSNALIKFFPNLILIEKDDQFYELLKLKFANTVKLIHGDILDEQIWELLPEKIKIVANIPYNLTTPLIQKIIFNINKIDKVVILLQREVAERLSVSSGNSNRGALTVALESVASTQLGSVVPANSFWPAPNVESQILIINPLKNQQIESGFIDFLYKGFTQKRKKLKNSLSAGLIWNKIKIENLLKSAEIDANLRPEDLTLKNWQLLWSKFKSMR